MHSYFVRITRPYEVLIDLVTEWSARASKMVVYEHVGDETEKTHIHMVIINSNIHKKQLKNIAPGSLQLKGNQDWSFKQYDGKDTAMIYMTKGKLDPKFNKGFMQAEVDKWKTSYVQYQPKDPRHKRLFDKAFDPEYLRERYKTWREKYPPQDTPAYMVFLSLHCRTEAFSFNDYFWTRQAINDYKMLVWTALYRYNIRIPMDKEFDKWRNLS